MVALPDVSQPESIRSSYEDRDQYRGAPSVESLIRETHALLNHTAMRLSPSKVVRLCRDYVRKVADKGVPFGTFLANAVTLDASQRRAFDVVYYRLSYADPTGESAVRNVVNAGGGVSV